MVRRNLIAHLIVNLGISSGIVSKRCLSVALFMLFISSLLACTSTVKKDTTRHSPDGSAANAFELVATADKAYQEGRWLEAEQGYRAVIQKVPEDYYGWFRLANTQLRQGQIDSAIRFYLEAQKRNPKPAKSHYNLSTAYLLMALDSLRQSSQRLREKDPGKHIIHRRISVLEKLINQPVDGDESPNVSVPIKNVQLYLESK
jgi:tetratricopeptide (TPR) repeat protein